MARLTIRLKITDSPAYKFIMRGERPNDDDLLYAGARERTRIVERTMRGVDWQGRPFAPYSEGHPYYFYPNRRGTETARQRSAVRMLKKAKPGTARLTRSRAGVRFASYGAFKRAYGRGFVDLFGIGSHPHMLQSIVVRTRGATIILGVYGEEAKRASGHNEGIAGRLPERHWFDVPEEDLRLMGRDIADHMMGRLA